MKHDVNALAAIGILLALLCLIVLISGIAAIHNSFTGTVNSAPVASAPGRTVLFCGVDQFGTPKRC
jgi:hypothetical protein